jgi:SAM-dependent methyltransferase
VRPDRRTQLDYALRRARLVAFAPGEYVGQESFMRASEILALASRAGNAPGVSVLDLCCGVAGPGRLIARELGCTYLGVDASASAVHIARQLAGRNCRFEVSRVPPVPAGTFDVVLLLETMLAFPDKMPLLRAVSSALAPGGRFAFTIEEGHPLTEAERALMPAADTVWPMPIAELLSCLEQAGLRVSWQGECTRSHQATVDSLVQAFTAGAEEIRRHVEDPALDELLAAHRLWSDWLLHGRLRKFALVAEKAAAR